MKKRNGKSRNTIYLSPSMKFNPGIMAYEPLIYKKINKDNKIPKKEKTKIAILSALLIILLILILLYSWYKLG